MSADNRPPESPEPLIFSAILTPHRSLSPTGFLIFMLVLGTLSFASGVSFLLMGAWPVFGFFGLDVLLVYWAFRINYRAARAYEEVTVTASELRLRKVSHHGRVSQWTLNPLWVRLDQDKHDEYGIERLDEVAAGTPALLARNRTLANAFFAGRAELEVAPMVHNVTCFPRLKRGDVDALDARLRADYDTSIVPGRFFGLADHFRLGIGMATEVLEAGLERLGRALDELA